MTRDELNRLVESGWQKRDIRGLFESKEDYAFFLLNQELGKRKKFPVNKYSPPDKRGEPSLDQFTIGDLNVFGLNPGCRFTHEARITYTGTRTEDFAQANTICKLPKTPDGYVWHHYHDYDHGTNQGTMYLMSIEHHNVFHFGGVSQYRYANSDDPDRSNHYK